MTNVSAVADGIQILSSSSYVQCYVPNNAGVVRTGNSLREAELTLEWLSAKGQPIERDTHCALAETSFSERKKYVVINGPGDLILQSLEKQSYS
jgi:hypothetical protein